MSVETRSQVLLLWSHKIISPNPMFKYTLVKERKMLLKGKMRQWEEERIKQKNKSLKWNKKNTFCEFIHLQFLNKDNRKKGGENLHFAALRWFSTDTGHQKINRKIPPRAPFCILHILSQTIRTPKNWDRKQNNVSWI